MNHDEEWQARRDAALAEINAFTVKVATDAWYPILDYERCVDCGKCHDFCLFGVYSIEDGKVKVAQPQNCKNNCPACSRVCPAEAVIFPKYERSPINGGSASEEGTPVIATGGKPSIWLPHPVIPMKQVPGSRVTQIHRPIWKIITCRWCCISMMLMASN